VLKAIVAGVSVCVILQVIAMNAAGYLYACCLEAQSAPPLWYAMLSSPLGAIVSLLPGFVAGWLYPRQGILVGFITGLIGNAIYSAIFLTMWSSVLEGGAASVAEMILRLLFLATSWGFGNAAAGGTAQLLRSNKLSPSAREGALAG
jgi:uncharacterized membrane protein YeaQ/YmgE (transglycosylase-associated protein family)